MVRLGTGILSFETHCFVSYKCEHLLQALQASVVLVEPQSTEKGEALQLNQYSFIILLQFIISLVGRTMSRVI